jgi:predicted aspartyl protease
MRWLGRWGNPRFGLWLPMVTRLTVAWIIGSMPVGAVPAGAQNKFVTEYQLDRDVVDIPFEYHEHQIIIKVQASDRKDLTFLFDSGANSPVVNKDLGLRGTHLGDAAIQEAEGVTAAEMIWLDEIQLGSENSAAKVYNIPVLVTDLSQLTRLLGRPIDGIVGISFMAGFVVEIDYDRHLLRFHRSRDYTLERRKPDNERSFLFDLSPSNPRRPVSTMVMHGLLHPKYDYDLLLDTGFGGYVSIAHLAAEEAGMIHSDTPRVSSTSYSVTRNFPSDKIRAPFLMLGDINLSSKIVSIDYRNKDVIGQTGIVGNQLLQNYHVTLDYPHKKLLLERVTTAEEPDVATRPSFGIVIRSDGKTLRVEHVKHDSPAQQAGVRNGDLLLALNGRPCSAMSTAEIANLLTVAQAGTQFLFRRGIDPNLGTGGDEYAVALTPSSPIDWKPDDAK